MREVLDIFAMVMMLALSGVAFVALDVAMRPGHYAGVAARPGRPSLSVAVNSLSQRLLPRLKTASAYRLVGLFGAAFALGLAMLIFAYEFSYYSTR
jgi:hypothetical protein